MPTVIIGADVCPIGRNRLAFRSGAAGELFHDLLPVFAGADLVVANLECPLIERPSPIFKTGPSFGEPGDCVRGIKAAGINILGLANNHIMDHGEPGLRNTIEACSRAGIETVGAGENIAAARRILIKRIGKIRIGILAVAEHEFSIASENAWGANPLDLMDVVRNINENRAGYDFLITLLHGSTEFHAPTPRIQKTCRFMIEMGANAVVVQHPHCLGGYEEYLGGHIVYGQGALVMDEEIYRDRESFHEGFLVKLVIGEDGRSTMDLVPFVQSDGKPGARRMIGDREGEFRRALAERSEAIKDEAYVAEEWLRVCEESKHSYMSALLGHNRVLRKLNGRGLITWLLYGKRQLLGVRNIVNCETHREAVHTIFNKLM